MIGDFINTQREQGAVFMQNLNSKVTDETDFFQGNNPYDLAGKYGSPLYVYNERILRTRCREIKNLVKYRYFRVNYSAKANSALAFFQIVREEGLDVDAMSPGEIYAQLKAGFQPENIFFISNNVSDEEMRYAIDLGIKVSVDSLSQLERYGRLNPGGKVAARMNPGIGAGHHAKVVTGGKNTKFGVNPESVPQMKEILKKYDLTLCGINQHIGSLFMDSSAYLKGAASLMAIAKAFDTLEFIDIGGGFGIPYRKQEGEQRLDLKVLGESLEKIIGDFMKSYGREITVKVEPGRYISAESGVLLGTVHSVKYNGENKYIGTDIGFNVLARPMIYDSHHDIEVYRSADVNHNSKETVTVVGNICESGDIIAKDRLLPEIFEGDLLGILDAGAYGHVMSSNYNNRLRPAQVLIRENSDVVLIRERDTLADIVRHDILL
jgi:diaminopimelate decarboxylase